MTPKPARDTASISLAVLGVSAGGFSALTRFVQILNEGHFSKLPHCFSMIAVAHRSRDSDQFFAEHLNKLGALRVEEAQDKQKIQDGVFYLAPAGYHILIESNRSFSLSVDPPVNFSQPSIDVLFESAVPVYHDRLLGIILTGANSDGAQGLAAIHQAGGITMIQDPRDAEIDIMPKAALACVPQAKIGTLEKLAQWVLDYAREPT